MKVVLIGAGNLGTHLGLVLSESGHEVLQVYSRDRQKAAHLASKVGSAFTDDLKDIDADADIVLIAISDGAINPVSNQLTHLSPDTIIAHTAGSVSSTALDQHQNYGVFYPLQTFSKDRSISWASLPVLITANSAATLSTLNALATSVSTNVRFITDDQRLHLHLCATIANNFSNHMFTLARKIAHDSDLNFDVLKPLIRETVDKVMDMDPAKAQTGPAIRGDQVTMDKHLELLSDSDDLRELYRIISASIVDPINS